MGFPSWLSDEESDCIEEDAGDMGSIPGSRRSPGGGDGNPLQHSFLENPIDREAWWATVHGVARIGRSRACKHIISITNAYWGPRETEREYELTHEDFCLLFPSVNLWPEVEKRLEV